MERKLSIFQRALAMLCAIAMLIAMVPGDLAGALVMDAKAETNSSLTVMVTDESGNPIADAQVELNDSTTSGKTGADGKVVLNLTSYKENDTVTATVKKEGYLNAEVSATAPTSDTNVECSVSLTEHKVTSDYTDGVLTVTDNAGGLTDDRLTSSSSVVTFGNFEIADEGKTATGSVASVAGTTGETKAFKVQMDGAEIGNELTAYVPGVTLAQISLTLARGDTSTPLEATCYKVSGQDSVPKLSWKSDSEGIATVDGTGAVTGKAKGTANITATYGAYTTTIPCAVTVNVPLKAITLNKNAVALVTNAVGDEVTQVELTATLDPIDPDDKTCNWVSSDTTVAKVEVDQTDSTKATVTAVGNGSATITVTGSDNQQATCAVTVETRTKFISLDKTQEDTPYGTPVVLTATLTPATSTDTITWTSSDPTVATVADAPITNGVATATVTPCKAGETTITATSNEKSATCKVTVTKTPITVTGVTFSDMVYNGKADLAVTQVSTITLSGVLDSDKTSVEEAVKNCLTFAMDDATTGDAKPVTVALKKEAGKDVELTSDQYTFAKPAVAIETQPTIKVEKRPVLVKSVENSITKPSDGNMSVPDTYSDVKYYTLDPIKDTAASGVLPADVKNVKLGAVSNIANWAYAQTLPGINLAISGVAPADFTLSGSAAENYTVASVALTGNITAIKPLEGTETLDLGTDADGSFHIANDINAAFDITNRGSANPANTYWFKDNALKLATTGTTVTLMRDADMQELAQYTLAEGENSFADTYLQTNSGVVYGPYMVKVKLDVKAPVVTLEGTTKVLFNNTVTYTISVTETPAQDSPELDAKDIASGVKSVNYLISNSANAESLTGNWQDAVLGNDGKLTINAGQGYLFVRATDYAGNVSKESLFHPVVIEADKPTVAVETDNNVYSQSHTVMISAKDAMAQGQAPYSYSGIAAIHYKLTDSAGNEVISETEVVKNDVPITMEEVGGVWKAPLDDDYYEVDLQKSKTGELLDGVYTLTASATDNCGNTSVPASQTLYFDNTAPEVAVTMTGSLGGYPNDQKWYYNAKQGGIMVAVTDNHSLYPTDDHAPAQDETSNYSYSAALSDRATTINGTKVNGNTAASVAFSFAPEDIAKLMDGELTLSVTAKDGAKNEATTLKTASGILPVQNTTQATFVKDTVSPVVNSITSTAVGKGPYDNSDYYYNTDSVTLTFHIIEQNINTWTLSAAGGTAVPDAVGSDAPTLTIQDEGKYTSVLVSGTDKAGNALKLGATDGWADDCKATLQDGAVILNTNKVLDRKAPKATIRYTPATASDTVFLYNNEDGRTAAAYYKKNVTATISIEDDNTLDYNKLMVGQNTEQTRPTDGTTAYAVTADSRNFYYAFGTDRAGNVLRVKEQIPGSNAYTDEKAAGTEYDSEYTIVRDTTNPTVDIKYTELDKGHFYPQDDGKTDDTYAYYNKQLQATYTFKDANGIDETKQFAGIDGSKPAKIGDKLSSTTQVDWSSAAISTEGTYRFTAYGEDKAGNPVNVTEYDTTAPNATKTVENVTQANIYVGQPKVYDVTHPVLALKYTQLGSAHFYPGDDGKTDDAYAYYNNALTATYTFEDANGIDENKQFVGISGTEPAKIGDKPSAAAQVVWPSAAISTEGTYRFTAYGEDKAGNALDVTEYDTTAPSATKTTKNVTQASSYIGQPKVYDVTSPTVDVRYTALDNTHYYLEDAEKAAGVWTGYYNRALTTTLHYNDANGIDENLINSWSRTKDGGDSKPSFAKNGDELIGAKSRANTDPVFEDIIQAEATNNGDYRYTLYGCDKAGNPLKVTEQQLAPSNVAGLETTYTDADNVRHGSSANAYTTAIKAIDTIAPTVAISYTNLSDSHYYDDDGGTAYYNKNFDAGFDFYDSYGIDQGKMLIARLFDGKTEQSFAAIGTEYAPTNVNSTHTVKTTDAEGIYKYQVYGEDKAGNTLIVTEGTINKAGASVQNSVGHNSTAAYTGHAKVLDVTNPTVDLALGTAATNKNLRRGDGNDRYYFNQAFTAAFTLVETNFDAAKVKATYGANTNAANYQTDGVNARTTTMVGQNPNGGSGNAHVYTADYAANGIYAFALDGYDRAGNPVVLQNALDKNVTIQGYTTTEDTTAANTTGQATSYIVAIDTVAPALDVKVDDFYAATLSDGNRYVVSLNHPYQKRTTATAAFTGRDCSPLSVSYDIPSTVGGQSVVVDNGDAYTYANTQSSGFNAQQTIFIQALKVVDLAGNVSTIPAQSNRIYLDTTAPTNDQLAPTISMTASANGEGRGPGGNPLFASSVTVNAKLTDPGEGVSASGLYQVFYRVTVDGNDWTDRVSVSSYAGGNVVSSGVIQYKASGSTYSENASAADETLTCSDSIDFTFDAQTFNYNDVKIYVWAVDNSGNEIDQANSAFYYFGIDVTSPTIKVDYDNNDVQNEKYFKANRTATVVVTERNFDANNTNITTESEASIGGWTYAAGSMPNGDDDTWTCQVVYSVDSDYTFDVKTADLLGHDGGTADYGASIAPQQFVIDKTIPIISISFDNNNVSNAKYYNQTRTATIEITEHNFSVDGAKVVTTANIQEGSVAAPGAGGWGSAGDSNSASVNFDEDGNYTMTVDYIDLAGNEAETEKVDEFTVDTTAPELEITGVEDKVAYNGDVAPIITYHDVNFDNTSAGVTIVGYKHQQGENLAGTRAEDAFGGSFTCDNIQPVKENDDIYTATGSVTDLAGNTTEATVVFSVNRFGSTYMLNKATQTLLDQYYTNTPQDIVVTEINVSPIASNRITVALNGDLTNLAEGTDYSAKTSAPGWQQVDYTIHSANFQKEGLYDVTIYSEDEAGNASSNRAMKENEAKTSELPINFVVDMTAPTLTITGVDSDEQYVDTERTIMVNFSDNITVAKMTLYLNDQIIKEYTQEELDQANGMIEYLAKAANNWQNFRVVAVDEAGNTYETDGVRYLLTDNLFIQYFNNKPLFYGSIGGVIAVAALIWLLLAAKRRKKEEQKTGATVK